MKNILVIEDKSAVLEEICDMLRMEEFNVFEAKNSKTGLKIAKKEIPNLIISDIIMPELNGFELFEELGKDKLTRNIPIIFLSAKANKETVIKGLRMGAENYIIKPVSPDVLLYAVNEKINK